MFAIVEAGGRQEKVSPARSWSSIELEAEPGAEITFDRVLLVENERRRVRRGHALRGGRLGDGRRRSADEGQEDRGLQDEAPQGLPADARATGRCRRACGSRASIVIGTTGSSHGNKKGTRQFTKRPRQ